MRVILDLFITELVKELRSRGDAQKQPITAATDPRRHDRDFRLASEIAAGMFAAIATSIEKINAALAEAEQELCRS